MNRRGPGCQGVWLDQINLIVACGCAQRWYDCFFVRKFLEWIKEGKPSTTTTKYFLNTMHDTFLTLVLFERILLVSLCIFPLQQRRSHPQTNIWKHHSRNSKSRHYLKICTTNTFFHKTPETRPHPISTIQPMHAICNVLKLFFPADPSAALNTIWNISLQYRCCEELIDMIVIIVRHFFPHQKKKTFLTRRNPLGHPWKTWNLATFPHPCTPRIR